MRIPLAHGSPTTVGFPRAHEDEHCFVFVIHNTGIIICSWGALGGFVAARVWAESVPSFVHKGGWVWDPDPELFVDVVFSKPHSSHVLVYVYTLAVWPKSLEVQSHDPA